MTVALIGELCGLSEQTKLLAQAFAALERHGRLSERGRDVRAYEVDGRTQLAQTSAGIDYRLFYYWAPNYGDQVPTKDAFKLFP